MDSVRKKFSTLMRGNKQTPVQENENKMEIPKPTLTAQKSVFYDDSIPKPVDPQNSTQNSADSENPTQSPAMPEISTQSCVDLKISDVPENSILSPADPENYTQSCADSKIFDIRYCIDSKISDASEKFPQKTDVPENSTLKSVVENYTKKSRGEHVSVVFSVIVESSSESENEDVPDGCFYNSYPAY